jgi:5-methylcytosine-specific restriction endonuclease McrA
VALGVAEVSVPYRPRPKVKTFSASALYKPDSRKKQKAREDRQWTLQREACRAEVYARAGGCCERCGKPLVLRPSDAPHERLIANINEKVPRSRGGDPLDPANCNCLCWDCHLGKGFHDH